MTNSISSASEKPSQFHSASLTTWGVENLDPKSPDFVAQARIAGFLVRDKSNVNVLVRATKDLNSEGQQFEMFVRDGKSDNWVKMTARRHVPENYEKLLSRVHQEALIIFKLTKDSKHGISSRNLADRLNEIGAGGVIHLEEIKRPWPRENIIQIKNAYDSFFPEKGKGIKPNLLETIRMTFLRVKPNYTQRGKDYFDQQAKISSKTSKKAADKITKDFKKDKRAENTPAGYETWLKNKKADTPTSKAPPLVPKKAIPELQEQKKETEHNNVDIKKSLEKKIYTLEKELKAEQNRLKDIENDINRYQDILDGKTPLPPNGHITTTDVYEWITTDLKKKENIKGNIANLHNKIEELIAIKPLTSSSEAPKNDKAISPNPEKLQSKMIALENKIKQYNETISSKISSSRDKAKAHEKIKQLEDSKVNLEKAIAALKEKQSQVKADNQI